MKPEVLGYLVVARDSEHDEFPRRFAVRISNIDDAVLKVAETVPEKNCEAERPLSDAEIHKLRLKVGQVVQYDPQAP